MTVAASSSSSAGGTPALVDNGLVSGLNTQAIIQALMTSYQEPITDLQNQQSTLNSQAADYQAINKDLLTVRDRGPGPDHRFGLGSGQGHLV